MTGPGATAEGLPAPPAGPRAPNPGRELAFRAQPSPEPAPTWGRLHVMSSRNRASGVEKLEKSEESAAGKAASRKSSLAGARISRRAAQRRASPLQARGFPGAAAPRGLPAAGAHWAGGARRLRRPGNRRQVAANQVCRSGSHDTAAHSHSSLGKSQGRGSRILLSRGRAVAPAPHLLPGPEGRGVPRRRLMPGRLPGA